MIRKQRSFDDHYAVLVGMESAAPPSLALGADAGFLGTEIELLSDLMKYLLSQAAGQDSIVWGRFLTQPSQFRNAGDSISLIEEKKRSVSTPKNDIYAAYRGRKKTSKKSSTKTKKP